MQDWRLVCVVIVASLLSAGRGLGASVGPSGYTNNFAVQPPAADWATLSMAGAGGDIYDTDAHVNANITASGVNAQTIADNANAPAAHASAKWSSAGLYLQTRPTGNRYTALMGKFVNDSG